MSVKSILIASVAALATAGCGSGPAQPHKVPDVRGERLDVAEETLHTRGLDYKELGGGAFGILVRSNWEVCDQHPSPGSRARKVELVVDRECYGEGWDD